MIQRTGSISTPGVGSARPPAAPTAAPLPREETVQAPKESVFLAFTRVVQDPSPPPAGARPSSAAQTPTLLSQRAELKNGLIIEEDRATHRVTVSRHDGGGAPVTLAEFDHTSLQLPARPDEGIHISNGHMSQQIGSRGGYLLTDKTDHAHVGGPRSALAQRMRPFDLDTYVVPAQGGAAGLQRDITPIYSTSPFHRNQVTGARTQIRPVPVFEKENGSLQVMHRDQPHFKWPTLTPFVSRQAMVTPDRTEESQ